jgi:hypothetical protein
MRFGLDSPRRKAAFGLAAVILTLPYTILVLRQYRAAMWAQSLHIQGIQRALALAPSNSDYWQLLGRFHLFIYQDPQESVHDFSSAIALNPYVSRYWLDLATAQRMLGNSDAQKDALEQALRIDPKTPSVAWEAANFFLVDGQTTKALDNFKTVIENDPVAVGPALDLSWRATHDVNLVLQHAMPGLIEPHFLFISQLMQTRQTDAAMQVWRNAMNLKQLFKAQDTFQFVHYLIAQRQVESAREVWADLARMSPALRPSSNDGNLIVNGDFEEDIITGGFSWNLNSVAAVEAKPDDGEFHTGASSLSIRFTGAAFTDSGISQFVAVKPHSTYEVLIDTKSQEIESANGPRVIVVDGFTNSDIAMGNEWLGTHVWSRDSITFTTGPNTNLLRIFIGRSPGSGLIRGRLWIDNIRMYER